MWFDQGRGPKDHLRKPFPYGVLFLAMLDGKHYEIRRHPSLGLCQYSQYLDGDAQFAAAVVVPDKDVVSSRCSGWGVFISGSYGLSKTAPHSKASRYHVEV